MDYGRQRVLIIAPHADDETLGCGGVIQKYVEAGSAVRILIGSLVRGSVHRYNKKMGVYQTYDGDKRLREIDDTMRILGVSDYPILFEENHQMVRYHSNLDRIPRVELVEAIESHIESFSPTILYLPSITKHQDHEALHQAGIAAARPYFWPGTITVYETDGELSFQPNCYVPLTEEQMSRKTQALEAYRTQLQEPPHPVSTQALIDKAKFRGTFIYSEYAEAFQIVRLHG